MQTEEEQVMNGFLCGKSFLSMPCVSRQRFPLGFKTGKTSNNSRNPAKLGW
jgi:hypothetical protein